MTAATPGLDILHSLSKISIFLICALVLCYALYTVYKSLCFDEIKILAKDSKFNKLLLSKIPLLNSKSDYFEAKYYYTFPWGLSALIQNVYASSLRYAKPQSYIREVIEDPATPEPVLLDWEEGPTKVGGKAAESVSQISKKSHPTIVMFPGITGNSDARYVKGFVELFKKDYRIVIYNRAGVPPNRLKQFKFFLNIHTATIQKIVKHVDETLEHKSPLILVGFSLGGNNILRYLGSHYAKASKSQAPESPGDISPTESQSTSDAVMTEVDPKLKLTEEEQKELRLASEELMEEIEMELQDIMSKYKNYHPIHEALPSSVIAAFASCPAYDCGSTCDELQKRPLYDWALTSNIIEIVKKHRPLYEEFAKTTGMMSVEDVLNIKSVKDVDTHLTAKMHGFTDIFTDFYGPRSATIHHLKNIPIPTLILHAMDDEVITKETIPVDAPNKNDKIVMALTQHGGHCAFHEAGSLLVNASELTLQDRLAHQFCNAILELRKKSQ